ncbi:MAG: hypothetical protein NTX15_02845 [Candidatus Kapabacteria bacterium]|nr:hypothetical protein [Candidatus Kapabacteria bacterium]
MFRFLLLGAFATLILSACSETTTNPSPTGVYVVSKAGSYYIHDNVYVKITNAGVTADSLLPRDSTAANGTQTIAGKSAATSYVFVGGVPVDTTFVAQEGTKVNEYYPVEFTILGATVNLGTKWVTTFDEALTSWTALNDTVPEFELKAGPTGPTYYLSAKLNFTGSKNGTEVLMVNGASITATKSAINLNATIYVAFSPGGLATAVPISLVRTYWFANGYGTLKIVQDAKVINAPPLPATGVPGLRQTVVRLNVVQ